MGHRNKSGGAREGTAEQATRDQEVLRANRELAAYFKGRRTEREARAALKTIKAFVRERERQDPKSLSALPGVDATKSPKKLASSRATVDGDGRRKRTHTRRRKPPSKVSKTVDVSIEPVENEQLPKSPESDEPTP